MEPKVAARIVAEASSEQTLRLLQRLQDPAWGGRRSSVVRVRVGQDRFRRELLRRYGNECAVTGQGPPEALEAAHLYRFSAAGRHYKDGGLLLRRDVHTLFDRGALLIEPEALRVVIGPPLDGYPQYASLAGKPVTVPLTDRQKAWIERHWRQFREPR